MKNSLKKFDLEHSKENIIVEVIFYEEKHRCSCVGVLLQQNDTEIKIGFNAKDDVVIDSLIIKTKNIIELQELNSKSIKILK